MIAYGGGTACEECPLCIVQNRKGRLPKGVLLLFFLGGALPRGPGAPGAYGPVRARKFWGWVSSRLRARTNVVGSVGWVGVPAMEAPSVPYVEHPLARFPFGQSSVRPIRVSFPLVPAV